MTAGNASGLNDGAAAMLIASEVAASRHGLTPRARIIAMASAGIAPRIMVVGPIEAARKLLRLGGLTIDQLDVIELNEAFASQAIATLRDLGLDPADERVNRNGGAIALGHPLGMSGRGSRCLRPRNSTAPAVATRWRSCASALAKGSAFCSSAYSLNASPRGCALPL